MAGTINTRRASRNRAMNSQINVTPFVDVMLVLLIVFMITAPLLTVGVPVELPKSTAPEISGDDEPLAVSIDAAVNPSPRPKVSPRLKSLVPNLRILYSQV